MNVSGILPLEKPAGMTSHDCVLRARRWFKTREVGHTGTLDPDVTGVLPLCVGRATKLVPILMEGTKAYEGKIALGSATTTEDAAGEVIERKKVSEAITDEELEQTFASLLGEIRQVPPMYSAVKVKGKRLYEYARAGETVERPVRSVTVYAFDQTGNEMWSPDRDHLLIPFSVICSKGTYVRTLAVEVGRRLGYPGHLSLLKRTMSAGIGQNACVSIPEMDERSQNGRAEESLLPVEYVLRDYPHYEVSDRELQKIKNGAVLPANDYPRSKRIVFTKERQTLAIYKPHPRKQGMIKPDVMMEVDVGR
ncbi:tRNA pseudouridine(55) synthase TruB [Salicibibacter cibarius]|uniref:tRNA pseudouridine synthase B n=1 Tax=Salicibibacter cibarius TaxID=2743000 RepID=A0A7T7CBY2_9BACI|nr:tRNA pseudouridine(55) synthase TruB [Salicibibacter cibarius]QQK76340.1 tRNA pseudouridine(55) synthase TruB [Salicibibacter cibarius]